MKSIDNELISVVIQGPVYRSGSAQEKTDLLKRAVDSIHQYLPQAEIIISTWNDQDVSGITDVTVVKSEQPEAMVDCTGDLNNINRQLLSTQVGIQAASRPYVLKFRADHYLTSAAIAQIGERDVADKQYGFLSTPVTLTNFFIRNPLKIPFLFHLSDLVMFGRKEDLIDLWQQPFIEESKLILTAKERTRILGNFRVKTCMRHVPEQSFTLGWLNKHGLSIDLPYASYTSWPLFTLWEQVLVANFQILDYEKSGIVFPPRFLNSLFGRKTVYGESDFLLIRKSIGNWRHKCRYMELWLNKYCFAWFKPYFLVIMGSHLLFTLSPNLEKKVRYQYRKLKKIIRAV